MHASTAFDSLLRRARRAAGLTQEELAERAGLSARVISDIERGVIRAPRLDTLELLTRALGLDEIEQAQWVRLRRTLAKRIPQDVVDSAVQPPDNRSTLPDHLTELVGRKSETDLAIDLLQRPGMRLLTLTGPGGIGKTRLALEVAGIVQMENPSSVAFVDLAPIVEPDTVLPAIASALRVKETAARSLWDELTLALCDTRMLVLDNFEQVIDAGGIVAELLSACPQLTILITSRVPLHLRSEHLFPVRPLALPDANTSVDADRLLQSEAVALFVQRAQAMRPDFCITDGNARAVAEICVRLDGLPLSIELAAAWTSVLSPGIILRHIARPLELLTGGARDLPARQRTLRDTIRWSYDLLTPHEQSLLRQFSVFAGGWTLAAAEAVMHAGDRPVLAILDDLMALCEKNLLRATVDIDDQPRFGMLGTILAFARNELAITGDTDATRDRHADYFLQLAEESSAHIGRDDVTWINLLEREHDNLRAAIAFLRESSDIERGLRLVGALGPFWFTLGFLTEGRDHMQGFLNLPGADARTAGRATALTRVAWLAVWQDDFREALHTSEEALTIWQELAEQTGIPETLVILGIAAYGRGDPDRSRSAWLEAVQHARLAGDRKSLANALNNLGSLADNEGYVAEAMELFQESLAVSEEEGIQTSMALALASLGLLAVERGDVADGERHVRQALRRYVDRREAWGVASSLSALGSIAALRRQPIRATRLMAASETIQHHLSLVADPGNFNESAQEIVALRQELGDAFQAHWDMGTALTVAEAVAEALHDGSEDDVLLA